MKKTLSVAYGVTSYVLFLGAFLYLIAFAWNVAPHAVSGPATLPPATAIAINIGLITLFGVQHSVMARPSFKRWWTRVIPKHLERTTFVLIATVMAGLIVLGWQPVEGDLWNVTGAAAIALYALSLLGWSAVPACSFLTDHFELFGLRQVWEYATGRAPSKPAFKERAVYKKVRHPMMLGLIVAMWSTPRMTAGHLVFAGAMTAYILVGIYFEERTLAAEHGQAYRDYQARVPKLFPWGSLAGAPSALEARGDAARMTH